MNDLENQSSKFIRSNREIELVIISVAVMIFGGAFLYFVGQYALIGRNPFQFFADSSTYHDIYSGFMPTPDGVIGVSYNFLGPLLILSATGGNIYLVMIANVVIFTLSMIFICRALNLDPVWSSVIQFLSPLTASSLMSVNKEIIVFPVLAFIITGYRGKSITLISAAVLVSLLARWQLTAFCIVLIGLYFVRNYNRHVVLFVLLMSISFVYYMSVDILRPVLENVEISTSSYTEGSGLFERLIELQNNGFYFLVAPIKAAHLLFSLGFRFESMIHPIVIYNDQIVASYCLVNFIFFAVLLVKKRGALSNDLIMISLVYLIVFALTPVYAPRYFYAVTILWALVLAGAKGSVLPDDEARARAAAHA